jgi:hypothetical protein
MDLHLRATLISYESYAQKIGQYHNVVVEGPSKTTCPEQIRLCHLHCVTFLSRAKLVPIAGLPAQNPLFYCRWGGEFYTLSFGVRNSTFQNSRGDRASERAPANGLTCLWVMTNCHPGQTLDADDAWCTIKGAQNGKFDGKAESNGGRRRTS